MSIDSEPTRAAQESAQAPADKNFELDLSDLDSESEFECVENLLKDLDVPDDAEAEVKAKLVTPAPAIPKAEPPAPKAEPPALSGPELADIIDALKPEPTPEPKIADGFEAELTAARAEREAQPSPTVVDMTVRNKWIRAFLDKQSAAKAKTKARVETAACDECGVDPMDPRAIEKVKVARSLKDVGATLTDLEKCHPSFWDLPLETDDGSDSRKLVLYRFRREWNRKLERKKKREAKITAKGWRSDYDDLSPEERRRERNRIIQQNCRARKKARTAE